MTLDQVLALANLSAVSVIPLILYLHTSNKKRWDAFTASLRKFGKRQRKIEQRLTALETHTITRYIDPVTTRRPPVQRGG